MRRLFALILLGLIYASQLNAQVKKTETVFIRVFENLSITPQGFTGQPSTMQVIDNQNVSSSRKLNRVRNLEDTNENLTELKQEIDSWLRQGFAIDAYSTSGSENIWITSVILKRESAQD